MFNANLYNCRISKWEELFSKYSSINSNGDVFDANKNSWVVEPIEEDQKSLLDDDLVSEINQYWKEDKEKIIKNIKYSNVVEASAGSDQDVFSDDCDAGGFEKPDQKKHIPCTVSIPRFYKAFHSVCASRTGKQHLNEKDTTLPGGKLLNGGKNKLEASQKPSKDGCVPSGATDEASLASAHQFCPEDSEDSEDRGTCSEPDISSPEEGSERGTLPSSESKLNKTVRFAQHKSDKEISPQQLNSSDRSRDVHCDKRSTARTIRLDQSRALKSSLTASNRNKSPETSADTSEIKLPPEKLSLSPQSSRSAGLLNGKLKTPLHSPISPGRLLEIPRPDSPSAPMVRESPKRPLSTFAVRRHLEKLYLQYPSQRTPRKLTLSSESPRTLRLDTEDRSPIFSPSKTLQRRTERLTEQMESFDSSDKEHRRKRLDLQPGSPESPGRFSEKLQPSTELQRASKSQKETFSPVPSSPKTEKEVVIVLERLAESVLTAVLTGSRLKPGQEMLGLQRESPKVRGQLNEACQLPTESLRSPSYNIPRENFTPERFPCTGNTDNVFAFRREKPTGKRITLDSAILQKKAEEKRASFPTKRRPLFQV